MPTDPKIFYRLLLLSLLLLPPVEASRGAEALSYEEISKYIPKSYNHDMGGNIHFERIMELGEASYPAFCGRLLAMSADPDFSAVEFGGILAGLTKSNGDKALPLKTIRQLIAIPAGDSGLKAIARKYIAEALGEIGQPQDVPYLVGLLKDPDFSVQSVSVRALGQIGGPEAIPALREWEEREGHQKKDSETAKRAREAIQSITWRAEGKPAKPASPVRVNPPPPPSATLPAWLGVAILSSISAMICLLFRRHQRRQSPGRAL